ncbi:MAG: hypothetical protein JST85_01375 [Acidobacteria bacterium]|nr:hypothetical protein [Acidobacteriota bacterium]
MTHQNTSASNAAVTTASALAIEANFDDITKAAFNYRREHVYPHLESLGIRVLLLSGKNAVRRRVAAAAKADVSYLSGVGHGRENSFCGYKNKSIFRVGRYAAEEVSGKAIHLLSCSTASDLGEDFLAKGCRAFFGYREEFAVPFEDLAELNDLAEAFFGSDAEIDRALAESVPVEQILDRVRHKFDENIVRLDKRGHREASAALESNRDLLIALFAQD